ncbi:MAG: hypothetical protein M0C28_01305 [Candidatus Moduliflexus flocculans]|nr:hypothetical protein [Candidatus Moduliflexus flocculans]
MAVVKDGLVVSPQGLRQRPARVRHPDHAVDGLPRRLGLQAVHGHGHHPARGGGQAFGRRRHPQIPARDGRLPALRSPSATFSTTPGACATSGSSPSCRASAWTTS